MLYKLLSGRLLGIRWLEMILSLCLLTALTWAHDVDDSLAFSSDCEGDVGETCVLHLLQRKGRSMLGNQTLPDKKVSQASVLKHDAPSYEDRERFGYQAPKPVLSGKARKNMLAGRSIYFVVIDRFARTDGNTTPCDSKTHWCGGTLKGIMQQLDYIEGMGFDTLWITPVVKQYDGETEDGTGFMGYWAKNHYEIDPHYGTAQDLKDLSRHLHDRGMFLMLDIVCNHVGPVHSSKDVYDLYPFNHTSYFHTLNRGNMTFDEYTKPGNDKGVAAPAQAMWSKSGAQCGRGDNCNCFACVPIRKQDYNLPPASWDACPFGKMAWNETSPCPWGTLSAYCMPGDFKCRGYNETVTLDGWFYDLGDLDQSNPFVRKELKRWARWMVEEYSIDMFRLDTASFVPMDFLAELQAEVGVPIIGEVTTTNLSYHASFQRLQQREVMDGVLNFPMYYTVNAAFCHVWWPSATGNLSFLGLRMQEQMDADYGNLDTLGNFVDNHDVPRITHQCKGDAARTLNAFVWMMLSKGTPILYYGSEVESHMGQREAFWPTDFNKSRGWYYFKALNRLREDWRLHRASMKVYNFMSHQRLAFTRGSDARVWVFLNNLESGDAVIRYCDVLPQKPRKGQIWSDYFTGEEAIFDSQGCLSARTNMPKVLVQVEQGVHYSGWYETFTKPTAAPSGENSSEVYVNSPQHR